MLLVRYVWDKFNWEAIRQVAMAWFQPICGNPETIEGGNFEHQPMNLPFKMKCIAAKEVTFMENWIQTDLSGYPLFVYYTL